MISRRQFAIRTVGALSAIVPLGFGELAAQSSGAVAVGDALEVAALQHSGIRYHPTFGLVTAAHTELMTKLSALCAV